MDATTLIPVGTLILGALLTLLGEYLRDVRADTTSSTGRSSSSKTRSNG
jgi:hypothetical protein